MRKSNASPASAACQPLSRCWSSCVIAHCLPLSVREHERPAGQQVGPTNEMPRITPERPAGNRRAGWRPQIVRAVVPSREWFGASDVWKLIPLPCARQGKSGIIFNIRKMRFYAKRLRVGAASDFADVLHRAAQDDRILRACDVDIGKIRVIGN